MAVIAGAAIIAAIAVVFYFYVTPVQRVASYNLIPTRLQYTSLKSAAVNSRQRWKIVAQRLTTQELLQSKRDSISLRALGHRRFKLYS